MQVVPDQIDNHQVLRALFGLRQHLRRQRRVHPGRLLHRALDRAHLAPALPVPLQESFRAAAEDRDAIEPHVRAKRRRVSLSQSLVQRPGRIARLECRHRERRLVGQAELVRLARRDRFLASPYLLPVDLIVRVLDLRRLQVRRQLARVWAHVVLGHDISSQPPHQLLRAAQPGLVVAKNALDVDPLAAVVDDDAALDERQSSVAVRRPIATIIVRRSWRHARRRQAHLVRHVPDEASPERRAGVSPLCCSILQEPREKLPDATLPLLERHLHPRPGRLVFPVPDGIVRGVVLDLDRAVRQQ